MRLLSTLTLAAALACLCAATTQAQSGRAKRSAPPGVGRGGGGGDQSPGGDEHEKPTRAEDYSRIFTSREVTERARITRRPAPEYPREERRRNLNGSVLLKLILRADGRVDHKIEVVKSLSHELDEEAIKVARQIEFEPAQKDGRKVSQYALIEYTFNTY